MEQYTLPKNYKFKTRNYQIVDIIGKGGFGITYKVQHTTLDKIYAIKEFYVSGHCIRSVDNTVVPQSIDQENYATLKQRFFEEAKTIARLESPNIVHVIDIFEENNTIYMLMEYIDGETLQEIIKRNGKIDEKTAINYIEQVANGLKVIHQQGKLHRDVKPENIMIDKSGKAILIDFGTARDFAEGITSTQTAMLTPGFAPFEQYSIRQERGAYTDIYALGATLYYCVTGEKPIPAVDRKCSDEDSLVHPTAYVPNLSLAICKVVLKAMALNPNERYQNINELLKALNEKSVSDENIVVEQKPENTVLIDEKTTFIEENPIKGKCDHEFKVTKNDISSKGALKLIPFQHFNKKFGYKDTHGNEVIACKYDTADEFTDGLALVSIKKKYGYINTSGQEVIALKYNAARSFSEGYAAVQVDKYWGFIDVKGMPLVLNKYISVSDFKGGIAKVLINNRGINLFGFIDRTGTYLIDCKYTSIGHFSKGIAKVTKDGFCGFIDIKDNEIIKCIYSEIDDFNDGLSLAKYSGKYGYIDRTGKEVIPFQYSKATPFKDGKAEVKKGFKWYEIDTTGHVHRLIKNETTRFLVFFSFVSVILIILIFIAYSKYSDYRAIANEQMKFDSLVNIESKNSKVDWSNLYIGQFYEGGMIFYIDETGEHGLICDTIDRWDRLSSWYEAKDYCEQLKLNGYDDWYLPSISEMKAMTLILQKNKLDFFYGVYWSSSDDENMAYSFETSWIYEKFESKSRKNYFRAVRVF